LLHGEFQLLGCGVVGMQQVVDEHVAAGRQGVAQGCHDVGGVFVVKNVMQYAAQEQANGAVSIQVFAPIVAGQDRFWAEQVAFDGEGLLGVGKQGVGMGQDNRVVVQVGDSRVGVDLLGYLVHVLCRRQARADVQELRDAGVAGQVPNRANQEIPLG